MKKHHVTITLTLFTVSSALISNSMASEADWHPVIACQYLVPDRARLACYDETVRLAASPAENSTNTAETLFGKGDADVRRELRIVPPNQLSAEITAVHRNGYKKLLLTLNNGQRWRQLDNDYLRLSAGDAVLIERAMAGSYLLRKQSGGRSIRVRRLHAEITANEKLQ